MEWESIKPYEMKGELPGVSEMEALKLVWADYREYFGPDMTKTIQDRFNREWSIETGLIEGAYNLDRGLTETLVEHGIRADLISHQANGKSPEQVASILRDQVDAIEGLFDFVMGGSALTTSYVRQLHQQLMRSESTYTVFTPDRQPVQRPLEKGKYKLEPNNPLRPDGAIHPYCPPEQVDGEMERLVKIYYEQVELPIEVQAAWLHHAFTQIHPFQDGNGRVARALATLVLIKGGLLPMSVNRGKKSQYIDSLESADVGEFDKFLEFIRDCQRASIFKISDDLAPPIVKSVSTDTSVDNILDAIEDDLVRSERLPRKEWRIDERVVALNAILKDRLMAVVNSISQRFRDAGNTGANLTYNLSENEFDGPRDRSGYRLILKSRRDVSVNFAFSAPARMRGLAKVTATFELNLGVQEQIGEYFLINYMESQRDQELRFKLWLETMITQGLKQWRNSLGD